MHCVDPYVGKIKGKDGQIMARKFRKLKPSQLQAIHLLLEKGEMADQSQSWRASLTLSLWLKKPAT